MNSLFPQHPVVEYMQCVCPAWASGIEDTKIFQSVKDPYTRELMFRSISKPHRVSLKL
jgi:hypothetical protein